MMQIVEIDENPTEIKLEKSILPIPLDLPFKGLNLRFQCLDLHALVNNEAR